MSKSNWQLWKEKNPGDKARPWDLLNPKTEYIEGAEADRRFNICKECPFLIKATNQCKKCGCFMNLKNLVPINAPFCLISLGLPIIK